MIYANINWQLASRGVARPWPRRPFQFSLEEGAPPATWESLHSKDLSIHSWLLWRRLPWFISTQTGGWVLPHPSESGREGAQEKWETICGDEFLHCKAHLNTDFIVRWRNCMLLIIVCALDLFRIKLTGNWGFLKAFTFTFSQCGVYFWSNSSRIFFNCCVRIAAAGFGFVIYRLLWVPRSSTIIP